MGQGARVSVLSQRWSRFKETKLDNKADFCDSCAGVFAGAVNDDLSAEFS